MKKISTAHLILLTAIILQMIVIVAIQVFDIELPVIWAIVLTQLTVILPFIIYCLIIKENPFKLIHFKKVSVWTIPLCIAVGLCSYPVVVCLNLISMLFVENAMVGAVNQIMPMGVLVSIGIMALMPAIFEETIFRGVIYNTYRKRKPIAGIILSALLFGLMHMNFNQLPYAIFLGLVLALVMEASDSIIAPMVVHFTMNASSMLLSFLTMSLGGEMPETGKTDFKSIMMESYAMSFEQSGMEVTPAQLEKIYPVLMTFVIVVYVIIALVAMVGVAAIIYAIFRVNKRRPSEVFKTDHSDTEFIEKRNGKVRKNRMIDIPLIIFIVYAIVECVRSIS